jgi:DNA mismatch repair protein MutS
MSSLNDSMYSQYLAWYQRHLAKYGQNTAVLMQVGKFYEIYDRLNLETNATQTNIREIADLCSLNLSEHVDPENPNLLKLFGGFPEMSLPKFEKQLLDSGFTVVVVVQKKNAKGDVEERIVDRISSPGIYENRYSAGRLENTTESCLLGLIIDENDVRSKYVGLAAIDVQTGHTWSTETIVQFIQNTPNIDNIEPFFMMHPPAEVVCWTKDSITESQIRSWFRFSHSIKLHMRTEKPPKLNCEFLREVYSMKTQLSPAYFLGLERYPQALNCVYATLSFVEEHIPSLLRKLKNNSVWVPENRVRLGNAALEQLSIVSNSSECLLHWFQKTYTAIGRRALRERILTPISDVYELESRFRRIDFLRTQTDESAIEKSLRTIYDLSRIHRKIHLHSVSIMDICHLLSSYKSISELILRFSNTESAISEPQSVLKWLSNDTWSLERMKKTETQGLERCHPWVLGVYPELDEFEKQWSKLLNLIREYASKFTEAQINIVTGEHMPFEFMTTKKRFEKIGISHNLIFHTNSAKSTNGSLESKEIRDFQNQGLKILRGWSHKQDEIWSDVISKWSSDCEQPIQGTTISEFITNWVANLDAEFSLARCAKEYDLISPQFISSKKSKFQITGLRHPIIERITTAKYVKHDIALGESGPETGTAENGLLIYGTNASGKSSVMKALGIAVLCAQTGIPVAATKFKIAPYNSIFTRILSNDNLWSSLSSFAVEMTEFRAILKYADSNSLVLGDELCSGTETRSATAIVSAGIQTLVRRGAQFLFATHLHEISEIEAIREMRQIKFAHLGVECNPITKQIIYNRNLEPGAGKSLYGLEVCYGLDMDPEFLELANTCRTQNSSRYNSAVSIRRCEVCKSTKDLESHHILHQVTANKGFVDDGIKTHAASNLTVLCDLCHKQHHSGKLEITGWRDTSEGRELCWKRIESSPASSISNDIGKDKYDMVKERLAVIMAKGKKERELLQIIASEFSIDVTISEIRSWKKQILGRSI